MPKRKRFFTIDVFPNSHKFWILFWLMKLVWWCDFSARFTWCSLRWFCPEIQHDLVMNQKQNPSTKTRITDRLYSLQWTSMKQMKHPVVRNDEWILTIMDDGDQMDWTMSTNQSGDDSGQCRKNWTFRDLEQRTSFLSRWKSSLICTPAIELSYLKLEFMWLSLKNVSDKSLGLVKMAQYNWWTS